MVSLCFFLASQLVGIVVTLSRDALYGRIEGSLTKLSLSSGYDPIECRPSGKSDVLLRRGLPMMQQSKTFGVHSFSSETSRQLLTPASKIAVETAASSSLYGFPQHAPTASAAGSGLRYPPDFSRSGAPVQLGT